jgi:DNA-binding MarR family transcriptional regulator
MSRLLLKDLPRYECLLEAAKEFPDLDPSAVEAFLHLLRTGDEAFGITERNLIQRGMSPGRFGVLMLLWRGVQAQDPMATPADDCGCGPRTPAGLADAAGVTRATMTGLIDTLERDGFVKREPDPHDRRMMLVSLTPVATEFLRDFMPGHFRTIAAIMSPLTEAERKTLVRLLGKVAAQAVERGAAVQVAT